MERVLTAIRRRGERLAARIAARISGRTYIAIDFPTAASNVPRWGRGRPPHGPLKDLIASQREEYLKVLATIEGYGTDLNRISRLPALPEDPYWNNDLLTGVDGAAIYSFIRARDPKQYLEIGSGNSTLFAARARSDGSLKTRIVSIDPAPRREVDRVCDEVVRAPFETTGLERFSRLSAGDVVFFDCSHRVYMNSDVTAFFLDVLPQLPAGVLVGVHDVFLPDDYPPEWADQYFTEQYLLAAWLLAGGGRTRPALASHFLAIDSQLRAELESMWRRIGLGDINAYGMAFWMSVEG